MAHNLATKADGTAAMMFTGETPWHGLGTALDNPATSAEAMHAAGLDFRVGLEDLMLADGRLVPDVRAIVREDTRDIFSTVGGAWKPVQNVEAFAFLDGIMGEEHIKYHTAGALGLGERVWLLAKLDGVCRIAGTDDITEKFLLLSNAHTGKEALRCLFTPIRVVCQNTLNAALGGRRCPNQVRIRHTGDIVEKMQEARDTLGLAHKFFDTFESHANTMASRQMTPAEVASYFSHLAPSADGDGDGDGNSEIRRAANAFRSVAVELFETAPGNDMPGVRGTAWAAYNAVTYYVDHQRGNRNRPDDTAAISGRLNRNWFGWWGNFKGKAWEAAQLISETDGLPSGWPVVDPTVSLVPARAARGGSPRPRAKQSELKARIAELEARLAAVPPMSMPEPTPTPTPDKPARVKKTKPAGV